MNDFFPLAENHEEISRETWSNAKNLGPADLQALFEWIMDRRESAKQLRESRLNTKVSAGYPFGTAEGLTQEIGRLNSQLKTIQVMIRRRLFRGHYERNNSYEASTSRTETLDEIVRTMDKVLSERSEWGSWEELCRAVDVKRGKSDRTTYAYLHRNGWPQRWPAEMGTDWLTHVEKEVEEYLCDM